MKLIVADDLIFDGMCDDIIKVQDIVANDPTIEAVRLPRGRWRMWLVSETVIYTCKECGFSSEHEYDYCPYCHAKMENGDE